MICHISQIKDFHSYVVKSDNKLIAKNLNITDEKWVEDINMKLIKE